LNHGCQEKGQEKGWKEEGREEEVGFLQQRGKSARAGFPLCLFLGALTAIEDGRSKMEDQRWKAKQRPTRFRSCIGL
jgi:hypothetical protein